VKTRAVLALGSNLGDREQHLRQALSALAELPSTELIASSSFLETVAVTEVGEDQSRPSYLNAVAIIDTELAAQQLHELTSEIENSLGRVRQTKWQDRTIDVDLIAFGSDLIETANLVIPHPRAHQRLFVLKPWFELEPAAEIPGHGRIADLIAELEK
jgi:2-amino-4-hydroxy-6-hydroxymethyldihydropteridine diphosphokinase